MTGALPIPEAALDDRLAFVGTSGSGKTYGAGTAVEQLLSVKHRVVIVDPLGVWWGLRLMADGVADSRWPVVIFGGPHGDLPINESAGALIGETVAGMRESCIVALDGLKSKSARRRFMLGFLEALYERAPGEPFHFIVDEADLFAPQKTTEPLLQSLMEDIVRRGRVKGFIPWLITQRPAVLSKDVLSQADGLIGMKLTASQDRDALGAWIEGNADVGQWKDIRAVLPTLEKGHGVIWLPGHGVLEQAKFPAKVTFDSSRTPKRGEKRVTRDLRPIDIEKLRDRLATVEAEAAASDPVKLKARVRELEAAARKAPAVAAPKNATPDPAIIAKAENRAYEAGYKQGGADEWARGSSAVRAEVLVVGDDTVRLAGDLKATGTRLLSLVKAIDQISKSAGKTPPARTEAKLIPATAPAALPPKVTQRAPAAPQSTTAAIGSDGSTGIFTGPQTKIMQALAMWATIGHARPSRAMLAAAAGYSPSGGTFKTYLSQLKTAGSIDYPQPDAVCLVADYPAASLEESKSQFWATLTGPQQKLIEVLQHGELSRGQLAEQAGYEANGGTFKTYLSQLRTLSLIDYPVSGMVALEAWVFDIL